MEFELNSSQIKMQRRFRDFAENMVKPLAREIDEDQRFPEETVDKLGKIGWLGLPFNKELGGQGFDTLTYILCIEELSKVCASTGVIVSTHTSLCGDAINCFGTEGQKKIYLHKLAEGIKLGAFALTEPESGSDLSHLQTTAIANEDCYIINGTKTFITNTGYADYYIVFASTDTKKGTKGISAFIVDKNDTGFSIGRLIRKMGIRGSATHEIILNNCAVSKERLLGEIDHGYRIAMQILDGGRIGIAAQALGIAEGALDETVTFCKERRQFGKTIADFQNTQFEFASMKTRIEAARFLVYRAAVAKDSGRPFSQEAAIAKLFASDTAMDTTIRCVQLHGGRGYTQDFPVERMMRDAKITQIYEGTNEIQKIIIASRTINER